MARADKAVDRLPSQREPLEQRTERANETQLRQQLSDMESYVKTTKSQRASAEKRADERAAAKYAKKELVAPSADEFTEHQLAKLQSAKELSDLAAEKATARQAELAAVVKLQEEEAELASRPVTLKLKGRFFGMGSREVAVSPDPPLATELPAGCRLLQGAIPEWMLEQAQEHLEPIFSDKSDKRVKPIKSGQRDSKRLQIKVEDTDKELVTLYLFDAYRRALEEAGEATGRTLSEFNAIKSLPTCAAQRRHWDFDADVVRYARRKPCSAILALHGGARLFVYDTVLKHDVTVLVPPGAILIFDGDVAHAGASYVGPNTRVHVYFRRQWHRAGSGLRVV